MTTLTFEDAKERLGKLAAERPDYVYERVLIRESEDDEGYKSCVYFDSTGAPSCIVGHAYADEIRGLPNFREGASAYGLLREAGADQKAAHLADLVQTAQDAGTPWGQAFQEAVAAIEFP